MRLILVIIYACLVFPAIAQQQAPANFGRKSFIFGTAIGVSAIRQKTTSLPVQTENSLTFPNFKIGYMISGRTALVVYLPGTIYSYKGADRKRDRGFEGIIPSLQFWIRDRWWLMGGAGLGMDSPAFYDIKNEQERKFYFGATTAVATGYELWRKGNFALDIQSRLHYGSINVAEGTKHGMAVSILVGFNFY